MSERTMEDLKQKQSLPLSLKISLTQSRIRQWINEFGESGVYIAFSGGKDSTVLCDIIDKMYPNNEIPKVFINTGLEYPEIVEFVKTQRNNVIIRPKMNFKQVIQKYGYPFISKEVSECVYGAQKCMDALNSGVEFENSPYHYFYDKLTGGGKYQNEKNAPFSRTRWKCFTLPNAPKLSSYCCNIMKKNPTHAYSHRESRVCISAEMAAESRLRTQAWLKNGCNGFSMKTPKSMPMAFWTEQDVLLYAKKFNVKLASVYGEIISDTSGDNVANGQLRIEDFFGGDCKLCTTGCSRTGCMFCGFGCHLEKSGEGRFVRMKKTHPKLYEWIMKPVDSGGLGYREVIDWINEHGGTHIEY